MRRLVTDLLQRPLLRGLQWGSLHKRSAATLAAFALLTIYATFKVDAYPDGYTGVTQKSGGAGCNCHSQSANTSVTLSTSATTIYTGETYTFTVSVNNSNQVGGGVNVAVDRGTLTAGTGLKKVGTELTHTQRNLNMPATWSFTYTAPSTTGEDKIYATGNAINNGNGSSGDAWNHGTTYTFNVVAPPSKLIALSKTSMNLGNVRVGQSKQDTMRIFSQGDADLVVSSSAMKNSSPFSASPSTTNRTLSTGTAEVNTITFSPGSRGVFVDTFVINNNSTVAANQRKTVVITGTGIQGVFSGNQQMLFGDVKVGQTKRMGYVITNTGDDTLFLNNASVSGGGYSIISQPTDMSLAPNQKDSVVVELSATAKQTYNGTLTLSAQGGVTVPTVSLAGNGVAPSIQTAAIQNVGGIRVGLVNAYTLSITNPGNDTLRITNAQFTAGAMNRFAIQGNPVQTILGGGEGTISINHTPNDEIADTVTLTILSNAQNSPTLTVTLFGTGTMPRMALAAGVDTLDFGAVRVTKTGSLSFQVTNPGTDVLTLGNVQLSAPFSLEAKPSTIDPKANGTVTIKFSPVAVGAFSGMAIINGDDPANQQDTVYLKGVGVNSALSLATSIDFGTSPLNVEVVRDLVLTNDGSAPVTIYSYKLNNNTSNAFRIIDSAAHTVAAGGTATVKVAFKPLAAGAAAAQLAVAVDDNSAPLRTVALSGVGVIGQLTVNPSSIDFGTIDTGSFAERTITLSNTGTAPVTITSFTENCSDEFQIGTIANPVIAAGASVTVTVKYTPIDATVDQCTASAVAEGNTFTVQLRGQGRVQTGSVRANSPIANFSLKVSPNPIVNNASVSFTMKRPADVMITMYDMNGRAVAEIANGQMTVGANSATFSTVGLANGEYFLVAMSEGQMAGEAKIVIQR
jgi:hypothetical protein